MAFEESLKRGELWPDVIHLAPAELVTLEHSRDGDRGLSEDFFLVQRILASRGIPYGIDSPDVIVVLPGNRKYRMMTKVGHLGKIVEQI